MVYRSDFGFVFKKAREEKYLRNISLLLFALFTSNLQFLSSRQIEQRANNEISEKNDFDYLDDGFVCLSPVSSWRYGLWIVESK